MASIIFLFITLTAFISDSRSYQYCNPVSQPEHGFVDIDINRRFYKFSCENGYILHGDTFVNCEDYQSDLKPKCVKNSQSSPYCYQISPPEHGSVEINEERNFYKFSCEDGYTLRGSTYFYCHTFDPSKKPECIAHVCEELPNPQNGQVDCDEGPLIPGKTCRYSCFKGYRLQGGNTRLCKFNLQWSGSAKCFPIPNVCQELSPPENGAVKCDKGDLIPGKACNVSCPEGYKLQGSHTRRCMYNYKWSGYTKCTPMKENSHDEPADDNSRAYQRTNARLSHPVSNQYNSRVLVDDDLCRDLQCEQLCTLEESGYRCRCCGGYKLNTDNRTCRLNNLNRVNKECLRKYQKVEETEDRACPDGYLLDEETKRCIDINECDKNNFGCSKTCVNTQGSAYCTCPRGFMLHTDKKTCIDIDECLNERHNCQHDCYNTEGGYTCFCRPGYILRDGHKCEGCKKNSYWSYEKNACIDCPKHSHTDSGGKRSAKDCICDLGYKSHSEEHAMCEDIDECSFNNFGCSYKCINIPGSVYCICPEGFMLDADNKTCIDIDECSIKNGGCDGLCINKEGSFNCICREGFISSNKDRYSCDDIDECSENNGGCEHLCINYRGGFYCACEPGYRLDTTLKNCTDIQCPKLPLPHYSHMNCTYRKSPLSEQESYSIGTTCTFICDKGFKNTQDDNKMKCRKDGTWKGTLPECKPQSCPPLKVPENGEIHPSSCSKKGAEVKQKCTFSCRAGYELEGLSVFHCRNNLTWNNKDIPICQMVKIQPLIQCPQDIQVVLQQGEATHNITVIEPTTNMESYSVHPPWVNIGVPVEFPVGATTVTFTVVSNFSEHAKCEMTVTVLDEEPPTFLFCPDPIKIEGAGSSGELVTWDEPVVTDNVELVSVFSLLEPNTTLTPGTYFVEYVARDSSGNIATCSFDISIMRMNCTDLKNPAHGKANCMDWMYGKLCNPECDIGYMRNPDDPLYYSCDDTGVWEPSDVISDCLQYTPANSSTCQEGFEFKKVDFTEENVCIACPPNAVWSTTTRKCE